MKKNEASVIIGNIPVNGKDGCYSITEYQEAKTVAVQALEEIQQYRAIGTPEECREAVEKQTDEKPTAVLGTFGGTEYECKNCGSDVCYGDEYCRWCGQKLDWSTETVTEQEGMEARK